MKSIYRIYDNVAEETVTYFIANNDEHAKRQLLNDLQKQPMDIDISVFKVCDFDETLLFKADPILNYPSKAENSVKMTNENIDKLMKE